MALSCSARKDGSKITYLLFTSPLTTRSVFFSLNYQVKCSWHTKLYSSKIKPKTKEHKLLISFPSLYLEPHFTFAKSLHCFCDPDHDDDDDADAVSDQAQTLSSHVARSHDGDGPRTRTDGASASADTQRGKMKCNTRS